MSMQKRVYQCLEEAFSPVFLDVIDESDQHRGHGGWREGGGTHLRVRLVAAAFNGQSRVSRHRMVNEALKEAFAAGLHALAIEAKAEGE